MNDEIPRSRIARAAAEAALVRVVHHYGATPEFVLIGGLVPELLCSESAYRHAGTTDVDVQVNLEIAAGAVNTRRLEAALANAEFEPDSERVWRWRADGAETGAVVKFELLADVDTEPAGATIVFDECDQLGAANLRGTGVAARDIEPRTLRARIGDKWTEATVNVTGLGGFLLAKVAAAHARNKRKDWYDIAFVLLENDAGGVDAAIGAVLTLTDANLRAHETTLDELRSNFADGDAQGTTAYVDQMMLDHPGLTAATVRADAILAVDQFVKGLNGRA
ncbi:MAG: hypothetical protein ACK5LJ_17630 [Paracoccus sp. (in: a-proteobacteria)]